MTARELAVRHQRIARDERISRISRRVKDTVYLVVAVAWIGYVALTVAHS